MAKPGSIGDGDHGAAIDDTLPAINVSNRVVQRPSTSSSDADSMRNVFADDEYDMGDYITDDEKISLGNEGGVIDSYLDDFLQREDELRKLMNLNNFNQILSNDIQFSEKDEDGAESPKLSNEDSAVLSNLEAKLLDIQKHYNELMNIKTIESETEDEEEEEDEENKVEEDILDFEETHKKLQDIDKRLENISNEKSNECSQSYSKALPDNSTKYIEKEYLNSLNEMTKKLDSLGSDELEEFLEGGLLSCDDVLGLN